MTDPTATWRTCLPENWVPISHDAFIYKMDEAACSVNDFYPYVPFAAQAYVTARIEEAFKSCISGSTASFPWNLKAAADKMVSDIKTANG